MANNISLFKHNLVLLPIMLVALSVGRWILEKKRSWRFKIAVSIIPYIPLAVLTCYIHGTDINLIFLYWIIYLAFLCLNPTLYYCQILDYYRLRKQAIKNIGWITGNAENIPSWTPYLEDENSIYQKLFEECRTKNMDQEYNLYREWKNKGNKIPYNEKKCRKLYKRANKLLKKSEKSYKSAYDFLSAGSELRNYF